MKKILIFTFITLFSCSTKIQLEHINHRSLASYQSCFQLMQKFFSPIPQSFTSGNLIHSKSLDELELFYENTSFIEMQKEFSPQEIKANNLHIQKLFSLPIKSQQTKNKSSYITKSEAELILDEVTHSRPNKNHLCYDPDLKIGFCFGRATIGHMEALVRGVHPDSIRKIWIAGDMKEWGHHVAVMIKAEEGWWVIDTNLQRVVKTDEWLKFYAPMKNPLAKSDIMIFASRADRFGPYDSSTYSGINLFNSNNDLFNRDMDYYRGYFHDYFEDLDKKMPKIKKFPVR